MAKSKSYAEQVSKAQIMNTALRANLGTLSKRGMTEEFVTTLGNTLNAVVSVNSEQEHLKGELKAATATLETVKQQLHNLMIEAVKVIKLEIPKEKWIEFGITGKR
ncbi:MAG: hypothetical protein LBV26_02775 [Bacteroidales bacterium]|jgi:hypothetical protein|nr:hypothetical protein [Bacteroidales bacterium]